MDLHVTQPPHPPEPRGASMKFTYPSGSRPLSGYTIKRGIGQGGFGEVYYATSDGGKEVALKLIRRNLDIELRGAVQCLNLKHPNLLSLYDVKEDDRGDSWVVMEYVAGDSLEDVLERNPHGLPPEEAMAWFAGIAAGVAHLHDRGIVHRDLKPGNIFSDDGHVKIGDYGLSKFISASRRSGQTESVGTVHYMAPEIANGRYGKEIDIYALGVILYELLTGHVPFDGESVGEVLMKHLTAEPKLDAVGEPYRTVIAKTLSKDPDKRVHSVAEMLVGLPAPAAAMPRPVGQTSSLGADNGSGRPKGSTSPTMHYDVGAQTPPPPPSGVVTAQVVGDEEPIWQAVRDAWTQLRDGYRRSNFNIPTKIAIWVLGAIVVVKFGTTLLPLFLSGAVCYAVYRGVRYFVLGKPNGPQMAARVPPPPPPAQMAGVAAVPPASAGPPPPPRPDGAAERMRQRQRARAVKHTQRWKALRREHVVSALRARSGRDRFTELLGSMLLAGFVSTAASFVLAIVTSNAGAAAVTGIPWERTAWMAMAGTIGAWGVLVPAKLWEGASGDPVLRRFVMMTIGLGVGVCVWGLAETTFVHLPYDLNMPRIPTQAVRVSDAAWLNPTMHDTAGNPLAIAYVAYFGFLFLAVRWWRQADPLRSGRLSLWAVAVCVFWAWLLSAFNIFGSFPQPWGMMTAATISIAVQLSSPWIDTQRRENSSSTDEPALTA